MKLDELNHVLRASAAIANENSMVAADTLKERIAMLEPTKYQVKHILQWAERRRIEARAAP